MINEALRLIRVYHTLKQGTLAAKLGVSQSFLSEIESGKKPPTFELLEKYSQAFNIPVSSIVYFAEAKDQPSSGSTPIAGKALQMLNWLEIVTREEEHVT